MVRTVTVYETANQRKTVFENVDVNTLGDLKTIFNEKGIDYTNMDFREGISGTQLLQDSSQLPHDISYRGSVTNDLMILLTLTAKKVASGSERASLYFEIKNHNLAEDILRISGRHYTNLSNEELCKLVEDLLTHSDDDEDDEDEEDSVEQDDVVDEPHCNSIKNIQAAFLELIDCLEGNEYLDEDEADNIRAIASGEAGRPVDDSKGYSMDAIQQALADIE